MLMEILDYTAIGFVLGLLFLHSRLLHAPNSLHVVNAIFKSDTGGCYVLQPIVVQCD